MFDLLTPTYRTIFIGLAVVWAAAYLLGMLLGKPNEVRSRRLAVPAKLVMIGAVLAYAVLWLVTVRGQTAGFGWLVLLGLLAGALGDLMLADVFPLRRPIVTAMTTFGAGHILYLIAALTLRAQLGAAGLLPVVIAMVLGGGIVAAIWALFIRNPEGSSTMNTGSLVYGLLLGVTTATAVSAWLQTGQGALFAMGMVVFLISDLMLAFNLIRERGFPYIRDVVWIIYSAAQVMIAFSIGAAAPALG